MGDELFDRLLVGQISHDDIGLASRFHNLVSCRRIAGVSLDEDEVRAGFRQGQSNLGTDTTGSTGHPRF